MLFLQFGLSLGLGIACSYPSLLQILFVPCDVLSYPLVSIAAGISPVSCTLPLLFPKPYSTSQNTTFFLNFLHSLVINSIHLPCIIPSNPHLCNTQKLRTPWIYSSDFIFNIHFSQIIILINNCKDKRNIRLGPLKNSLFASL